MRRALYGITAVLVAVGITMALSAPPEQTQGEFAKMLFVHVPSVIAAYLALATGLVAALAYLIRGSMTADRISAAAIEVGVVFTSLTLLTGMIWGRPVWGVWWDWGDARMMSTAVMFFFYLGYLALRRNLTDPEIRAKRSAILAIIAFVQVPIVHFSVQWFRTLHQGPTIIRPDIENAPMDPEFARALGINLIAFLALFVTLLILRTTLARLEDSQAISSTVAGDDVVAPELGGR
jgi:heme exporter protein C